MSLDATTSILPFRFTPRHGIDSIIADTGRHVAYLGMPVADIFADAYFGRVWWRCARLMASMAVRHRGALSFNRHDQTPRPRHASAPGAGALTSIV